MLIIFCIIFIVYIFYILLSFFTLYRLYIVFYLNSDREGKSNLRTEVRI